MHSNRYSEIYCGCEIMEYFDIITEDYEVLCSKPREKVFAVIYRHPQDLGVHFLISLIVFCRTRMKWDALLLLEDTLSLYFESIRAKSKISRTTSA